VVEGEPRVGDGVGDGVMDRGGRWPGTDNLPAYSAGTRLHSDSLRTST
jgi:hypothetical protein